ncbi:MAG: hypothetical protein H8E32_11960 [Nitrospinae bacterium]|nr:hypothetical protein [Nitrospinota bacterium]
MNKKRLTSIAGGLWCIIGFVLVLRGLSLYQLAEVEQHSTEIAITISGIIAGLIGLVKGKFVLSKTANKNKSRIYNLNDPVGLRDLFSTPFYFLIPMMMGLGVMLRSFNEYLGGYIVVAAIYCGVGMALIVSSRVYWFANPQTPEPENP